MREPRRGFTLVELIVVVAIIAMLMALLVVLVRSTQEGARHAQTRALIEHLDTACDLYREEQGQFPPMTYAGSRNLHAFLGQPTKASGTPYFTFQLAWLDPSATSTAPVPPSFVVDRWGRPLDYVNPGSANAGRFDIRSTGRDGVVSVDDILNGQRD